MMTMTLLRVLVSSCTLWAQPAMSTKVLACRVLSRSCRVLGDAGGELKGLVDEGDGGEIFEGVGCGYRGVS